ncbi:hypothetical protein BO94DRAFT_582384 [Aspergillus sclerotioniger CBS 115572]|uniref:F-box domain-containing protein n=1 Tax=Aspergillus sclerotioniger CBS 115572 TaxID=1450535 RepID=A0A317XAJ1_9EURO|nr:hypothetical protein BO94DRAFT_582384 [Aspergillus sclerotioniger CBS 115572]PWY93968.1 hypothetical protein BO94DRAFT_582384 [Aspergillus sclerotioniger CBS 115572]
MKQPHHILFLFEILEEILLHLDATTLLLSQRVCTFWHALIKKSTRCQIALFFKPSTVPLTPLTNRTLNPFLTKPLLKYFLRKQHPLPQPPKCQTYSQIQSDRGYTFCRPEASWREMLLQQPPALRVGVVETHHNGTQRVAFTETVFQPGGKFIRMKDLEGPVSDGFLLPAIDCPVFWTDCVCRPPGRGRGSRGHLECGKEVARRQLKRCDLVVIAKGPFRLPLPELGIERREERTSLRKWLESLVERMGEVKETHGKVCEG